MATSRIKELVKAIVRAELQDLQSQTPSTDPMQGTVTAVNDDGTVDVQAGTNNFQGLSVPTPMTVGTMVTVIITQEGVMAALPQGSQPLTT